MTNLRHEILRLARYGIVGGTNALLSYCVFAVCLRAGMHFSLATLAGGLFGMALGFQLHGRLVFANPGKGRFMRFCLIAALLYGVSVGIQGMVRPTVNGYLAGVVAAIVTVPISFLLNRRFVFSDC